MNFGGTYSTDSTPCKDHNEGETVFQTMLAMKKGDAHRVHFVPIRQIEVYMYAQEDECVVLKLKRKNKLRNVLITW